MGSPQGTAVLSKNLTVMKVLIEECLSRKSQTTSLNHEEIVLGMKMLQVMISQPRLYILADADRFAYDFAYAMKRYYVFLNSYDMTKGLANCAVIVLHTGDRTAKQKERYIEVMDGLNQCHNVLIWHVGEWR